jgi:hypothetical protein
MRFTASHLVLSAALVGCVLAQPNVLRGTKREAEISFGGQISTPVELDDVVAAPAANATAANTTAAGDDKWYLVDKVKGECGMLACACGAVLLHVRVCA